MLIYCAVSYMRYTEQSPLPATSILVLSFWLGISVQLPGVKSNYWGASYFLALLYCNVTDNVYTALQCYDAYKYVHGKAVFTKKGKNQPVCSS